MLTEVKTVVDQVKVGVRGLGDRAIEDERDTRQDRGGNVSDMRLQLGFGLKTAGGRFARFGPQNLGEALEAARGIIRELASRRAFS